MTHNEVIQAVNQYAQKFHGAIDGHTIVSPLGAWLLIALASKTAVKTSVESSLQEILGMELDDAFNAASSLLVHPHDYVASACAAWSKEEVLTPQLASWLSSMQSVAQTGPIPPQHDADMWIKEHTLGLIDKFPVDLQRFRPDLLLSTALATKVTWHHPFDVNDDEDMTYWTSDTYLFADCENGHDAWLQETKDGSLLGVHSARAKGGIRVFSVIAEPEVDRLNVINHAYEIATQVVSASRSTEDGQVNLFDLPVGSGAFWQLREHTELTLSNVRSQQFSVTMPAWKASNNYELNDLGLGFEEVANTLAKSADMDDFDFQANQVAVGSYSQKGFEAAAVTSMAIAATGFAGIAEKKIRSCDLLFNHPYAVVAVVEPSFRHPSPWDGMPVFSAWVQESVEAESKD